MDDTALPPGPLAERLATAATEAAALRDQVRREPPTEVDLAQSLPAGIPYRPQLILIAFTVAFVSLVVQGGTLPWLIRALGLQGIDVKDDRRLLAQLLDDLS